ncbi:MAG: hypothetical protein R3C44_20470 [Chloroflexota bacterium]
MPLATGMSIYWPSNAVDLADDYATLAPAPSWAAFLEAFVSQTANLETPLVRVTVDGDASAGGHRPS